MSCLFYRDIYDLQITSRACAYCTTLLTERLSSSLIQRCPATSSGACVARFCNRLCLKRSELTHPLLCPAQNPASVPLLAFARKHTWMALHALVQCTTRLLLAYQQQGRQRPGGGGGRGGGENEGKDEDWRVYCALADLGMEERAKGSWCVHIPRASLSLLPSPIDIAYVCARVTLSLSRLQGAEPDRATWQAAHKAFRHAFMEPPDAAWQKRLAKVLKRPPPKEVADALFMYDGFLHGLGRMSLSAWSFIVIMIINKMDAYET
jgi:hypothetical protein